MELAVFRQLLTSSGQELLSQVTSLQSREEDFLAHFTALARTNPPELARAALETVLLRRAARVKFPGADRMYFTREALEQASNQAVASYRSLRYRGYERLLDLGCSVGGDTLALAGVAPTLGIDLDPLRMHMARANAGALGLAGQTAFLQADLRQSLPLRHLATAGGAFFDPARRLAHRRIYSVKDYQPPLEQVRLWLADYPALGVKLSPGVDLAELADYEAEVEFISLNGELKEAVLWFGPLKTAALRATLLPGGHTLAPLPGETPATPELSDPRLILYEPDPTILRAGLVRSLGQRLDACQLDPDIAYLTAGHFQPTPFARAWQVEAWLPFSLKRLRLALRERGVGQVVIKKRGSPLEPQALIHQLKLQGDQARVVVLTHLRGRPVAILCLPDKLDG